MKVFEKQLWHLVALLFLIKGLEYYLKSDFSGQDGSWLGLSSSNWFLIAVIVPVMHQLYVLVCWRLELYYKSVSRIFGNKAFPIYKFFFAVLIIGRPLSVIALSYSNRNTFDMSEQLALILSVILFLPVCYLFYSLIRYFGMNRAFGIDHFEPEQYKNSVLVKKAIFKYTPNAMYVFGFLALWIPALFLRSEAGLVIALFNHGYIWVHYYFTEKPDMQNIYGKQ